MCRCHNCENCVSADHHGDEEEDLEALIRSGDCELEEVDGYKPDTVYGMRSERVQ